MRRIHTAIVGAIAAGALLAPAGALADFTIGNDLSQTADMSSCAAGTACTYVQTSISLAPQAVSPIDGRIVRWRLKAGAAAGPLKLRVLSSSPPEYTATGSSAAVNAVPGVNTFTTNLPIKAGDTIGLDDLSGGGLFFSEPVEAVSFLQSFNPPIDDGDTRVPDSADFFDLLMNADVAPPGGSTGPSKPGVPAIGKLRVTPSTFRAAKSGGSIARKAKVGASVSYVLSMPAKVAFKVERAAPGRKQGGKCRRPGTKAKGKRCTRYAAVKGSFSHSGNPAANKFKFRGRMQKKKLAPGRYRLVGTPSAAGKKGAAAHVSFRIAK
jgi:hypothetical protein